MCDCCTNVTAKAKRKPAGKKAPKAKTAAKRKSAPKAKKSASKRTAAAKAKPAAKCEPLPAPSPPAGQPIRLIDKVGISDATSLKSQLIASLVTDAPIVVDADAAEAVDTAVVQLLVAFCNAARAKNKTVSGKDANEVLRESAHLLGLQQYLAL